MTPGEGVGFAIRHRRTRQSLRDYCKQYLLPVMFDTRANVDLREIDPIHYIIGEAGQPGLYCGGWVSVRIYWLDPEVWEICFHPDPLAYLTGGIEHE